MYEYVDRVDRFDEASLPGREHFFNKLSESTVTDDDYAHTQNVWPVFNIHTFCGYHDLCQLTDVLILAYVFESFLEMTISNYDLDPGHFYSLLGFPWNAMLEITRTNLELIKDIHQHLFFESVVRRGVALISKREAVAKNRYIPDTYDIS